MLKQKKKRKVHFLFTKEKVSHMKGKCWWIILLPSRWQCGVFIMQCTIAALIENTTYVNITRISICHTVSNSWDSKDQKISKLKIKYLLTATFLHIRYVNNRNEAAIKIGFQVAHLLAKEGKPFTNGELIKWCLQQLKKCVQSTENKLA